MIDLAMAGKDWEGWYVGPWGRAKCWKLHAPDGAAYYPGEVAEVYKLAREVDYLQTVVRQLRERLAPGAVALTPEVAMALRVAAELIIEAVPRISRAARRRAAADLADQVDGQGAPPDLAFQDLAPGTAVGSRVLNVSPGGRIPETVPAPRAPARPSQYSPCRRARS